MKKLCLFCIAVFCTLCVSAENAIAMKAFDQFASNDYATIVLKNNLSQNVDSVEFQITYIDMSGVRLAQISYNTDSLIAPGTKIKLKIPSFCSSVPYHYYKSQKISKTYSPPFKIWYHLVAYHIEDSNGGWNKTDTLAVAKVSETDSEDSIIEKIVTNFFIGCLILGLVIICLHIVVGVMAYHRGRNVFLWVLLSFILTPLATIIILLIVD